MLVDWNKSSNTFFKKRVIGVLSKPVHLKDYMFLQLLQDNSSKYKILTDLLDGCRYLKHVSWGKKIVCTFSHLINDFNSFNLRIKDFFK